METLPDTQPRINLQTEAFMLRRASRAGTRHFKIATLDKPKAKLGAEPFAKLSFQHRRRGIHS